MAKRRKKRRRRKGSRLAPVLVMLLLLIVVAGAGIITSMLKKYSPSDARMSLADYYGQETEGELVLILQDRILEERGKIADSIAYIPYQVVAQEMGGRFYWDQESGQMLYTTPTQIQRIDPETSSYEAGDETVSLDYTIVKEVEGQYYIALDFLEEHMEIKGTLYENPDRAVIICDWGTVNTVAAREDTVIRYQGGIKSPILSDVQKGQEFILLEQLDNWSRVMSADGIDGYVENKGLGAAQETEYVYDGPYEENFTSLTRDYKINLAWHQVTSEAANQALGQTIQNVTGVNVISPTWFSVVSTEGAISSLASSDYVNQAHAKGMEVWGLIDNFNDQVSTLETLSSGSARAHIIEKLLEEASRVGMDGINLDFEALTQEEAPHFLQFVRELSVACRNNKLVLSIDNPVPQYTAFYNRKEQGILADYVIIMGYDEHYAGSEEAGSVASYSFVENGIQKTLEEVPAEKVINAVPFYTRFWKTDADGTVTSEALGMDSADERLANNGAEAVWDEETRQYYAEFEYEGSTYQIWLEEERSIEEKMGLIREYNLAGVASWRLGYERSTIWDVILRYVN